MPQEKREILRKQHSEWQQRSPHYRSELKERYRNFKRLPHDKKKEILQRRKRWHDLSDQKKREISQRFRDRSMQDLMRGQVMHDKHKIMNTGGASGRRDGIQRSRQKKLRGRF